MDDGVVRVSVVEGRAHKIEVGTGLDQTYGELFRKARRQAFLRSSREIGIKVILFGCFWLEALCNQSLREILARSSLSKELQKALASVVERGGIASKLELLAIVRPPDRGDIIGRAKKLFELRNRLVHFREQFEEISGPVTIETLENNIFGRLQETELVKLLKPPALTRSIKDILETKRWFDCVRGVERRRRKRDNNQ